MDATNISNIYSLICFSSDLEIHASRSSLYQKKYLPCLPKLSDGDSLPCWLTVNSSFSCSDNARSTVRKVYQPKQRERCEIVYMIRNMRTGWQVCSRESGNLVYTKANKLTFNGI